MFSPVCHKSWTSCGQTILQRPPHLNERERATSLHMCKSNSFFLPLQAHSMHVVATGTLNRENHITKGFSIRTCVSIIW